MRALRIAIFALALSACASHSDRTKDIRSALDANNPKRALELLNDQLETDSAKQLPEKVGGENTLFLLDRAMVLQELRQYGLASRDLEVCDKQIEVLDFKRNTADDLGKYLFSDDTGPYKAPAYEKLMINTMNMVNYLARGDLNGSRIEARRLAVMQKFIRDSQDPAEAMMGPGSYLAGFTFEKSGSVDEAVRYYDEALAYGEYRSLAEPLARLSQRSSVSSPRIRALTEKYAATPASEETTGELLIIVNFGRVPAKVAKRVPIGIALTYASGALSPNDQARASYLAGQGLVTWVNYPELGKSRGSWDVPWARVDGSPAGLEGILAVDREAERAWDDVKGAVVASAITRMLTRVVAGEGVRQVSGEGVLGALLSLGTQATLTATDTPDTRSWATLPARIAFGRLRLAPGQHRIELGARGSSVSQTVTLTAGGWAALNLTVLG